LTVSRVLMLFNRPRAALLAEAEQGRCPDELLYGLRTLRERGWPIETSDDGFAPSWTTRAYRLLNDVLSHGGRRTGFHLQQALRLRTRLRRAELIFATADSSGMPVLLLRALGLIRTPVITSSIGLAETFGEPVGAVYGLYRRLLREAAAVIVYASDERAALIKLFGLAPEKVHFVTFGVQTDFFAGVATTAGPPLAFGIDHRRAWPTFLAAAAGYDGALELVSNPDLLRGLARPRNVLALPPEPIADLRARMQRARFVVLPVRDNNYSGATISLLQAMAAGKAVIVSRTRAVADGYGLVDGENCLLVPPGDVPALAAALDRLAHDEALVARLGANAAAHVRARHDIVHLATALENVWRGVRP